MSITLAGDPLSREQALSLAIFALNTLEEPAASSPFDLDVLAARATEVIAALALMRDELRREPEHLYEKCAECHLFVEPNDTSKRMWWTCPTCRKEVTLLQFGKITGWYHTDDESIMCGTQFWTGSPTRAQLDAPAKNMLAEFIHLHRGDTADEALDETHEARPSGLRANLAAWRAYGPPDMRARFAD